MLWTLAPNSTKPAQRVSTQRGYWAVVGWNWKLLLPLVDYAGTLAKLISTVFVPICPVLLHTQWGPSTILKHMHVCSSVFNCPCSLQPTSLLPSACACAWVARWARWQFRHNISLQIISSLLCRERRKTASFQQAPAVISFLSPNELSLVFHFAPSPSPFVAASFSYYCSQKWLGHFYFFLFGTQSGAFCPLHFTLAQSPIVQERWYFPIGLLEKCWYFLTPPHKDHSLHFNGF